MADDLGKNSHVILPATVKVQHGFLAETGGPNGERIALVVLLVGVLEDVIDVGRPLVVPVDGHLTSGEEDSVDLAQDIVELGLRVMIVKRKHLRAGHFQVLHIAGADVGLVLLERLSEVLGVLGVDSDDWVLRRKGEDSGQEQRKDKRGYLHHRRINNYLQFQCGNDGYEGEKMKHQLRFLDLRELEVEEVMNSSRAR